VFLGAAGEKWVSDPRIVDEELPDKVGLLLPEKQETVSPGLGGGVLGGGGGAVRKKGKKGLQQCNRGWT